MHGLLMPELKMSDYLAGKEIGVEGERVFHLVRVLRVKPGEEVMLLSGQGGRLRTKVVGVGKSSITLHIEQVEECERSFILDLAFGIPRRETFCDIIKKSVELGIRNAIPLETKFSHKMSLEPGRVSMLVESAMIQSNNPFRLQVESKTIISHLQYHQYDAIIYFTEKINPPQIIKKELLKKSSKILMVIGPEGGLHLSEEEELLQKENLLAVHLPAYLMKCPTALCTACGYIFAHI